MNDLIPPFLNDLLGRICTDFVKSRTSEDEFCAAFKFFIEQCKRESFYILWEDLLPNILCCGISERDAEFLCHDDWIEPEIFVRVPSKGT